MDSARRRAAAQTLSCVSHTGVRRLHHCEGACNTPFAHAEPASLAEQRAPPRASQVALPADSNFGAIEANFASRTLCIRVPRRTDWPAELPPAALASLLSEGPTAGEARVIEKDPDGAVEAIARRHMAAARAEGGVEGAE